MTRRGDPWAPRHTTQTPEQRRLEAGAPETAWAPRPPSPTLPSLPLAALSPFSAPASPSVCPQHFLSSSLSSPPASHSPFHQLPHPLFLVHICFSLLCLHGSPRPPFSLPPWLPLPFHLPPSPSPPPLKLPVPEARTSKGDQSCAPPSKTRLCQERPPTTPSHPHRVDCNSP